MFLCHQKQRNERSLAETLLETFVMTAEAFCDRVDIEHVMNVPRLLWQR